MTVLSQDFTQCSLQWLISESNALVKGNMLLCSVDLFAVIQVFAATWLKKTMYLLLILKQTKIKGAELVHCFIFSLYFVIKMLSYNMLSTYIFKCKHLGMNPFENIAWKWQAQVESSWGLRCTGPSPLSCYVDLLIYMKTHIHLFMCSTIPFLVKDINYFLSAYFIFSHKSTAVEIQAAS